MTAHITLRSPAIHCDGCANSIKRSLGKLAGVQSAEVHIETKRITIAYDDAQTNETALRERLTLAGFPPED